MNSLLVLIEKFTSNVALLFCLMVGVTAFYVFVSARYYRVKVKYVLKTVARLFGLSLIEICVKIYDPSAATLLANTGPPVLAPAYSADENDNLCKLIGKIFKNCDITIVAFDNKPLIHNRFTFAYQSSGESKLTKLYKKHQLSRLLVPAESDMETIVNISNWVHSQWEHGNTGVNEFKPDNFNAERILARAQLGDQFWCHVYSMTFIQVAAALGYQARLVALTSDGYESSDMHAVAEVWSDSFSKWVVIDTDFNIWYEQDGVPLDVLEIHNKLMTDSTEKISIKKGPKRPNSVFEQRICTLYKYYKYFYIDMRNDWLSQNYFPGHPARSDKSTIFWSDKRLPPVLNLKTKVLNKNDLYWDLNRTHMTFSNTGRQECCLNVSLDTVTPNFDHFEIFINDGKSDKLTKSKYYWNLHHGENKISIRSVNSSGLKGIKSSIAVQIMVKE